MSQTANSAQLGTGSTGYRIRGLCEATWKHVMFRKSSHRDGLMAWVDVAHGETPERMDSADTATTQACAPAQERHDPNSSDLRARPDRRRMADRSALVPPS